MNLKKITKTLVMVGVFIPFAASSFAVDICNDTANAITLKSSHDLLRKATIQANKCSGAKVPWSVFDVILKSKKGDTITVNDDPLTLTLQDDAGVVEVGSYTPGNLHVKQGEKGSEVGGGYKFTMKDSPEFNIRIYN